MPVTALMLPVSKVSPGIPAAVDEILPRRPLRVFHIIPALGQGGAERLLADLVAHSAGYASHHVLQLVDLSPFFDMDDAVVASLGLRRGQISPAALRRARAEFRAAAPDVVHGWLYHGNLLSALLPRHGVPLLWSIHNTDLPPGGARPMTRLTNRLCSLLSRQVPWRIVYCAEAARALHEEKLGYDRTRGVLIENGIDFARFAPDPARRAGFRAAWKLPPGALVAGCIGRFDPQKDHATVLAAIARLAEPRLRLLLAGTGCGPDNPALSAMLREAGLADRVLTLGPVADMPGLLSALDLLVIGSAFGEALPMVGLEAVASGLPVVATAVGSVAELVLDPRHLAPPRDSAALAAAVAAALPYAEGPRPGPEAMARLERLRPVYSIDRAVAAYHALYRDAAALSPGR